MLFLQALTLEAGAWTVLQGVRSGSSAWSASSRSSSRSSAGSRTRRCSIATGLLITGVLVVLVGHTVQTMQVVGWMPVTPVEGLTLPFWAGMWFGVFPTWEGLLLQAAALVFVLGSYFAAEALRRRKRRRILAAPVAVASTAGSAPDLPGEMGELRLDQLLPRERDRLGRAGHRDDDRAAVGARSRA